jgi:putative flippase GtrA
MPGNKERAIPMHIIKKLMGRTEIRFLLVGGFNTVASYAVLLILDVFFVYRLAYVISFIISVTINFFTHKHLTFRSKGKVSKELVKFIGVYVALFFLGLLMLHIFIDTLDLAHWLAFGIQTVCIAALSYFGHKYISFRAN